MSVTPPEATSPTLTTFHLFPYLPTELRLKIYTYLNPPSRILKISYSPSLCRYISNTPPPPTLSITHESRLQTLLTHTHLTLGPTPLHIPISYSTDTLYISSLAPILQTHLHDLLYDLSTSSSRHHIQKLAIDRRVWNELCENGLLAVIGRWRGLREVDMVVEFGRVMDFCGELAWLEAPEWRSDLRWVAERAGREVGEERERRRGLGLGLGGRVRCVGMSETGFGNGEKEKDGEVKVRCVILTRGGEQA